MLLYKENCMLDLSAILNSEQKVIAFDVKYDLAELSGDIRGGTADVTGTCTDYSGYIELVANFNLNLEADCARCADIFETTISFSVKCSVTDKLENEENDDYVLLVDGKLDIDELCRSSILLNLPSRFLCSEDCKGLCSKCGANLNTTSCGCVHKEIDPRLLKLKELLKD